MFILASFMEEICNLYRSPSISMVSLKNRNFQKKQNAHLLNMNSYPDCPKSDLAFQIAKNSCLLTKLRKINLDIFLFVFFNNIT